MLYDKYLNKARKINNFVNKIYRMRFVLLGLSTAIVTSIVSLEIAKGNVSFEDGAILEYVYGDDLNFKTKAFLNASHVEYSLKNENKWSVEEPTDPGVYYARGVSKNGFGATKTTKPLEFTISKKAATIRISQNQVTYGDKPAATSQLFGTDKIDSYTVDYDDEFSFSPKVKVNLDTLKILNDSGRDVTHCYELASEEKEIQVLKRNLTIKFKNETKYYDGQKTQYYDGEIASNTSLANGDSVVYGEVDPGENEEEIFENYQYSKVFDIVRGERSVKEFYNVNVIKGSLTVKKIPLQVIGAGIQKEYDGLSLTEAGAFDSATVICDYLLPNHQVEVTYDNAEIMGNFKGICDFSNTFTTKVIDNETGEDVLEKYYSYDPQYKNVSCSKREITLTLGSVETFYNGEPVSSSEYTLDKDLVGEDTLTIDSNYLPVIYPKETYFADAGIYNEPYSENGFISIVNNDVDVADQYEITIIPGILLVKRQPINVSFVDYGTRKYQGNELEINKIDYENSTLLDSKFTYVVDGEYQTGKYVGEYSANANVKILLNNEYDVTQFFDISYSRPTWNIEPRTIDLKLEFTEPGAVFNKRTYDGKDHEVTVTCVGGDNLISGEKMLLNNQEKAKVRYFKQDGYNYLDDFCFSIIDENTGEDVTSQYEVRNYNDIYIEKAPLYINMPQDEEIIYDGLIHDVCIQESQLETGDFVTNEVFESISDYGDSFTYTPDMVYVDNSECYDITYSATSATQSIVKRPIEFTFSNYNGVYDNQYHDIDVKQTGGLALPDGFYYSAYNTSIRKAKTYSKDDFDIEIYDENGNVVTDNFDISKIVDSIKIEPFELSVTYSLPETTPEYTGEYYEFNNVSFDYDGVFPEGEEPRLMNTFRATDAGTYKYEDYPEPHFVVFSDGVESSDWEENYRVTSYNHWNEAQIKEKEINVTFKDVSYSYTGENLKSILTRKMYEDCFLEMKDSGNNDITESFTTVSSTETYCAPVYANIASETKFISESTAIYGQLITSFDVTSMSYSGNMNKNYDFKILSNGSIKTHKFDAEIELNKNGLYTTYSGEKEIAIQEDIYTPNSQSSIISTVAKTTDQQQFWKNHNLKIIGEAYSINNNPYKAGFYDVTFIESSFKIQPKATGSSNLTDDYYQLVFLGTTNGFQIKKRSLSIIPVGSTIKYSDGNKADEKFTISGLQPGDAVYIYDDVKGIQEEITSDKTNYQLIDDMVNKGTYSYKSNGNLLNKDLFKIIRTDSLGNVFDITNSYSINYQTNQNSFVKIR